MNLSLVPISEGLIDYCLENRIKKDEYTIDEFYFRALWILNKEFMRVIIVDDDIVGLSGFLPDKDGLLGYLILTTSYPKYAKYVIKQMREVLSKFKCQVKFTNHNDDSVIHKWYGLIGFKRVGDYWIREATI